MNLRPLRTWGSRIVHFALPVAIGVALLVFAASNRSAPQRSEITEPARSVRVIEVVPRELTPRVRGYGEMQPARTYTAVARVSAAVEFRADELERGAIIAAGTEVLRLSPADLELRLAEVEAQVRASDARITELDVRAANTRETLALDERALALLEEELERNEALKRRGSVPQTTLDRVRRDVLAQRKVNQELRNSLALLPSQLEVEREQRAVHEAQAASARLDLERTRFALPFDARIAEVGAEAGQFVQPGHTLFTADGIASAEVAAAIPADRLATLARIIFGDAAQVDLSPDGIRAVIERVGLRAVVRNAAGSVHFEWPARVVRTLDTLDPNTRTVGVVVAVENPYADAVPGTRPPLVKGRFVEVELLAAPVEGILLVPRVALREGRLYVVDEADRLEIRRVEIAYVQGELAAIASGLQAGERVVVTDLVPALPGMALDPVLDADEGASSADAGTPQP